jgi:hypothetical protein
MVYARNNGIIFHIVYGYTTMHVANTVINVFLF